MQQKTLEKKRQVFRDWMRDADPDNNENGEDMSPQEFLEKNINQELEKLGYSPAAAGTAIRDAVAYYRNQGNLIILLAILAG